jgi:hypothetical protein
MSITPPRVEKSSKLTQIGHGKRVIGTRGMTPSPARPGTRTASNKRVYTSFVEGENEQAF